MIPNRCACEYDESLGGTVPPAFPCGRVATNQVGEFSTLLQPSLGPGVALFKWTGLTSGAVGFHTGFFYAPVPASDPQEYQQWIVMNNITGTFSDGENLKLEDVTGLILLNPVPSYSTRATVDGGAGNDHVNCDTGGGPSGGGSGGTIDTNDPGGIIIGQNPQGPGPPTPDSEIDPSDLWELNTYADYSANVIPTPATVTGQTSGATAMFVAWPGGNLIRLSNCVVGPTNLFFLPSEEFVINPVETDPVLPTMLFGMTTGATIV